MGDIIAERLGSVGTALLIDLLIGDPVFPWHPVRIIGKLAQRAETISRKLFTCEVDHPNPTYKEQQRLRCAGVLAWMLVMIPATVFPLFIHVLLNSFGYIPAILGDGMIIWASFALKDLAFHAKKVYHALAEDENGPLYQGRIAVAHLVGRDPEKLDTEGVARACVESIAESSVDSIAGPLFYAIVFGPWASMAYRAINTMDSLFGHKNTRYKFFGWWSARSDDVANFVPARIASFLGCLCAPLVGGRVGSALNIFWHYRKAHESPNAGHPEAAYAGILHLRLGGPTWYPEEKIDKPWINPHGNRVDASDIVKALSLLYWNSAITIIFYFFLFYLSTTILPLWQ
jgi:adenosylcobinamide-phosphate synthase